MDAVKAMPSPDLAKLKAATVGENEKHGLRRIKDHIYEGWLDAANRIEAEVGDQCFMGTPFSSIPIDHKFILELRDAKAEIERLRGDNESTDGTDAAHPSYWRGCDATFAAMAEQLRKILDGEDDCSGVCNEPWDTLRRRVLTLRGEVAKAKTLGAVEELERVTRIFSPDEWNLIDSRELLIQLAAELRKELA